MLSIAAAVIILTIKRSVSERYYPLYVLAIALALQYSHTLASAQLSQNDAMLELYLANLVKAHGFWDLGFTLLNPFLADYAAMLSVAILPNVYSLLLNIDVVWFYQFIVPVIFSVVPLALYQICKTEFKFTNKMAFLSAFFFMSFYTFYDEVPRQWIAELFLVLVIYLIIRTDLRKPKENTLLVLFVASLTVSHYSVSYIFLYYVVLFLIGYPLLSKKNGSAERRYGLYPLLSKKNGSAERRYGLRLLTVALLFIIVAAWYVMASGGGPFYAFLELWAHTVSSLASGMFAVQDPHVAAGLGANVAKLSLLHKIGNYWIIATTPIITLGLAIMVWRRKTEQINPKALLFSLASFATMAVAVVVPTLGAAMNGNRAYELALIFLAPRYGFGLVAISDKIAKLLRANGDWHAG